MNLKSFASRVAALSFFAALIIFPEAASAAAQNGIKMCAFTIIPSLFPFFAAGNLISELSITRRLGRFLSPVCEKLFKASGIGGTAFVIGITAGYPLGAAYVAEMRKKSEITREEASNLLIFCNNSGPAFIIGALGVGVFGSSAIGLFLYAVHIISAIAGGIIFSPKEHFSAENTVYCEKTQSFSSALTKAIKSAVAACISVCGFIIAFSVIMGIIEYSGLLTSLAGIISARLGTELHFARALLCGLLELGNGIASMQGLGVSPYSLALAAFILGFGGLSVHFQTFALLEDTDIKTARYVIGRFIIALIGSAIALLGALLIF